MGLVVAAIVSTFVLGIPVALALDPRCRGGALIGLGYLYGSGVVWLTLFAFSLLHIGWSAVSATILAIAIAGGCWFLARRTVAVAPAPASAPQKRWSAATIAIDVLTAYTVFSYTLYATLARVWEWDFWAIWGLKARVFLEIRRIDWRFLANPNNSFCHPDYPLLLPLNYDWIALINGGWDDRWLGLVGVAFGVAFLLLLRELASREMPPVAAAALTFIATAFAFSHYIGLAEAPMIAFAGAAVLFLRRAVMFDDKAALRHGAILLGLAASTKNEGLALIVAVAMAMLMTDRKQWRRVLRLWPALAMIAPWMIIRGALHLQTDIAQGAVLSRVAERLRELGTILQMLVRHLPDSWLWVLMLAAIVLVPSAIRASERFVYSVVGVQLLFYIGAYLVTPHALQWHIETSWPRLTRQIATPLLFSVTLLLARTAVREETLAHAEARSEQL